MTRRDCLVASGLALVLARAAAAQTRLSQQEAAYQGTPKGLQMCGTCTLFVRPNACKVVDGEVTRTGWCKLYDLAD